MNVSEQKKEQKFCTASWNQCEGEQIPNEEAITGSAVGGVSFRLHAWQACSRSCRRRTAISGTEAHRYSGAACRFHQPMKHLITHFYRRRCLSAGNIPAAPLEGIIDERHFWRQCSIFKCNYQRKYSELALRECHAIIHMKQNGKHCSKVYHLY
jgi:hypothetical protein